MKAIDLRKKTIRNFAIALVITALLGVGIWINNKEKDNLEKRLKNIKGEISKLDNKSRNLESKQKEITKYIEIWKRLPENKKETDGINMDNVNDLIASIARDNFIVDTEIKLGLPNPIKKGIFNTKKVNVLYTKATLKFKALDDNSAMNLYEFFNSIPGYYAVKNITMNRRSAFSNEDFVNISKGKFPRIIDASAEFYWYAFKSKNLPKNNKNNKKSKRLIKL